MLANTTTMQVVAAASVTVTLPAAVAQVQTVITTDAVAGSVAHPVVTGAPAAGQVQFTGTPGAPSATLTFNAALTAADLVTVTAVPVGALPASA